MKNFVKLQSHVVDLKKSQFALEYKINILVLNIIII